MCLGEGSLTESGHRKVEVCNRRARDRLLLPAKGQTLIRSAMSQMQLSAQAYHRILKLARTIADLAGCEEIGSVHLAEAFQYRPKRKLLKSGVERPPVTSRRISYPI